MRFNKIIFAAIGGVCLMSCNSTGANYKFKEGQPDYSNKASTNNIRIGAWVAPPPGNWNGKGNDNFITQDAYDEVAESGINVIYCLYEQNNKTATIDALKYAEKAGIEYLARDSNVSLDPVVMELEPGEVRNMTKEYNSMKALRGWLIQDEPSASKFESLSRIKEYFSREFPGKEFYVNLFPTYANTSQLGVSSYEEYIDQYLKVVKPDFLSYDHYTMMQDGYGNKKLSEDVLWNLDLVAKKCKQAGIPMYTFVQAISYDETTRVPNEQEIRHQVLTQLAYGSRSIQYFCYWTPLEFDKGSPSMITVDGKRTAIYDHVKKVNSELRNIDEAFLEFSWDATMPVKGSDVRTIVKQYELLENPVTSFEAIKKYSATQNTLISRFVDKEGREAFFIVNFSDPSLQANDKVVIEFAGGSQVLYYNKNDKKVVELKKHKLELDIEPGDGYFVIPF